MAECTSCGGFVTDDYKRVFADNEGNIPNCRSCRAQSGPSEDDAEEESEREVLLRDVSGDDTSETGSEGAESASARPDTERSSSDESVSGVASAEAAEDETAEGASGGARERIAGLFASIRG